MKRRDFFRATAALGAGAAAATLGSRAAMALPFGDVPAAGASKMLPADRTASSVLECFLYGGLTQWETFYVVEEYGRPDNPNPDLRNTQYYTFNNPSNNSMISALTACGEPTNGNLLTDFGLDAAGKMVKLGPFVNALKTRPDVLDRTRVVVNRHSFEPHEAAIPMALCGRTLGAPALSSLGSHIQRYFVDHSDGTRKSPYSYAFTTNTIPSDNVLAAVSTGTHPGAARPLLIKVDGASRLNDLLSRSTVGGLDDRQRYDELMRVYIDRYNSRMKYKSTSEVLRAKQFNELVQAVTSVENAAAVQGVLDPSLFELIDTQMCGDSATNYPRMSLNLATHLLTHPTEPARYACFIDGGLIPADGGGGYDSHGEAPHTQSRNFKNTLLALLDQINEPGENDPTKLDLDKTMIILNMEFGRSPQPQGELGRNHWPYGYVQVYIGGPITSEQKGVYGAIGEDGYATTYTTPTENRMAALVAMGIWPFNTDSFGVSDVQQSPDEITGVELLAQKVLGYSL